MRKEDTDWISMENRQPTEADGNRYEDIIVTGPSKQDAISMKWFIAVQHPHTYTFWKHCYSVNITELINLEANAVANIPIDQSRYDAFIDTIYRRVHQERGKLITTGIGKAGQVAHNLATTFCSTGTPAVFLHPTEARHGDLGIITINDVILMISNSGETEELEQLLALIKNLYSTLPILLITGNTDSVLAYEANHFLFTGHPAEVCPLGLTPTTSTTVMTVIGDILITMMMERIGFTAEEYYKRHHGGYLGNKAKEMSSMSSKDISNFTKKEQDFIDRDKFAKGGIISGNGPIMI